MVRLASHAPYGGNRRRKPPTAPPQPFTGRPRTGRTYYGTLGGSLRPEDIVKALIMALLLTPSLLHAQEGRPWSILSRGAGEWVGEEKMPPAPWAPDGMESTGRISAHLILGGRGLASEHVQEADGQVLLVSHTVFRWDESRDLFVMHFVTAAGGEATVLEGRQDGDRLIFEGDGPMGPMRQTFRYGSDTMEVSSEAPSPDSREWATIFQGRYRAVAPESDDSG